MKKIILFFLVFSYGMFYAQKSPRPPFPKSIIDVGVGAGTNYGMLGAQAIIGYKGCGILAAGGYVPGNNIGYQVGLQLTYKWVFANACYGTYTTVQYEGSDEIYTIEGLIVMVGGRINLVRSKKLFLQIGAGWAGGGTIYSGYGEIPVNGPTATIGINYRIAFSKNKTEEVKAVVQ